MLKIKVFDCEDENKLTDDINDFIKEINNHDKEVVDIKFSTSISVYEDEQIYCFSALVMYDNKIYQEYKPKRYEIVEKVESDEEMYTPKIMLIPDYIEEIDKMKKQQKEFIKYLEDEIEECFSSGDCRELKTFQNILQKNKSIIGED